MAGISSPGAHTGGPQLVGRRSDRKLLKKLRKRKGGQDTTEADVMVGFPIELTPLPQFEHLPTDDQHTAIRELVRAERDDVMKKLRAEVTGRPAASHRARSAPGKPGGCALRARCRTRRARTFATIGV